MGNQGDGRGEGGEVIDVGRVGPDGIGQGLRLSGGRPIGFRRLVAFVEELLDGRVPGEEERVECLGDVGALGRQDGRGGFHHGDDVRAEHRKGGGSGWGDNSRR